MEEGELGAVNRGSQKIRYRQLARFLTNLADDPLQTHGQHDVLPQSQRARPLCK